MTTATTPLADVRARVSGGLAAHLPEHLARLAWDDERLVAYQRDRLRALVDHARERSQFTPAGWAGSRSTTSATSPACP